MSITLALLLLLAATGCGGGTPVPYAGCEAPLAAHTPSPSRFLHQDGARLVDGDGAPVTLRAVNLGGWLHVESWMFGGELDLSDLSQGSESQLLARVDELYGADAAERFRASIHAGFITEADFERVAELGFNAVRLPINHTVLDDPAALAHLDQAVAWADTHDLWLILDLHAAPGGQSELFTVDPDQVLLWDDPDAQDELVADWGTLAARYADAPSVGGYDLLNEPDPPDDATLLALYDRILTQVRAHDPEHLVFLEGPDHSRSFDLFTERPDPNMAYSPHVYLWVGWPDRAWLDSLAALSACHDAPVWVGEFGEDRLTDVQRLREGFDELAGWAIWPWKKVDVGGQPGVTLVDAPDDWHALMASLTAAPGTPQVMTEAQAMDALDGFLDAAANATVNAQMIEALGLD